MKLWTPLVHRVVGRYRRQVRRSEREDLAQVGFLGLWIGLRTFKPGKASLKTWLWTCVNREIVDYLRMAGPTSRGGHRHVLQTATAFSALTNDRHAIHDLPPHAAPGTLEDAIAVTDPEPACERDEVWRVVDEALPPRAARLVRLVYHDGLLQREAGKRVGITQEMVSRVLTDARNMLKRRLA